LKFALVFLCNLLKKLNNWKIKKGCVLNWSNWLIAIQKNCLISARGSKKSILDTKNPYHNKKSIFSKKSISQQKIRTNIFQQQFCKKKKQ